MTRTALLLALGLAGCGGATAQPAAPAVVEGPPPAAPPAARQAGCALPAAAGTLPALIPRALLPARTRVIHRQGRTVTVAVPGELLTVFNALAANAPGAGLRVTARDFEQIEAELSFAGEDQLIASRFGPLGACARVSLVELTAAPR